MCYDRLVGSESKLPRDQLSTIDIIHSARQRVFLGAQFSIEPQLFEHKLIGPIHMDNHLTTSAFIKPVDV